MRTMPSAEFRKTYAKLTEPTTVTVNGHLIGVWTPHRPKVEVIELPKNATPADVQRVRDTFNSRPFTPVPKNRRG